VAGLIVYQDRLVSADYPLPIGAGNVLMGQNSYDPGKISGFFGGQALKAGMRNTRPFDTGPDQIGAIVINSIFLFTGHFSKSVLAGKRFSDTGDHYWLLFAGYSLLVTGCSFLIVCSRSEI
jgi:hypothetical protein